MRNFLKTLSVIALVAVIGFSAIGCEEPDELDKDLNGTWVDAKGNELKFDNGTFEQSSQEVLYLKGPYTTSDNKITMTTTHVNVMNSGWCTKSELHAYFEGIGNTTVVELYDLLFVSTTYIYSINDGKLILAYEDVKIEGMPYSTTYTKK